MSERLKYPVVITLICLVAAGGLALTYSVTKDPIARSKKSELVTALAFVLPAGRARIDEQPLARVKSQRPKDDEKLYIARDAQGAALGYAAIGSAQGYSSRIKVMVGVDPELRLIAIRILEQQETPGLGERTREKPATRTIWQVIGGLFGGAEEDGAGEPEPQFQRQFRGKTYKDVALKTEQGQIAQLTGATITSRAVVTAVRGGIADVQKTLLAAQTGKAGTTGGGQ